MDRITFNAKIEDLLKNVNKVLKGEIDRLWCCGGIDVESYPNDYRLPRIILVTALKNTAEQFEPLIKGDRQAVRNLRYF